MSAETGDLKVVDNVVYRWDGRRWEPAPLAEATPEWAVRGPGVWYVTRDVRQLVHMEEPGSQLDRKLNGVEREVAITLLRCALARLEGGRPDA